MDRSTRSTRREKFRFPLLLDLYRNVITSHRISNSTSDSTYYSYSFSCVCHYLDITFLPPDRSLRAQLSTFPCLTQLSLGFEGINIVIHGG